MCILVMSTFQLFQFTHPRRGATSPSSPDKEKEDVSIHAPQEGCDYVYSGKTILPGLFQFTHPRRGAT